MGLLSSKEGEKPKDGDAAPAEAAEAAPEAAPVTRSKPKLVGGTSRLIDMADLVWLNMTVPVVPRPTTWSAIYLSHRDGKSFQKMVHCIRNMSNTLLLVRDTKGHVFGMYCGDEWKAPKDREEEFKKERAHAMRERRMGRKYEAPTSGADTHFYGTGDCALLAVRPEPRLYRPTRMNENYMYLQTTWIEEDMNGIAMGGMPGLFGVHLDNRLDTGKFRGANGVCMTFNNPCLASSEDFDIEEVEVWVLGDEEVAAQASSDGTVLDKAETKADQRILELAGKKFYADTLGDD